MDVFDLAQAHEQRLRDHAVEAAIAKATPHGSGAENCVCCRELIPEDRRRANPKARTCLDCQVELEEKLGR